jgi:hypothetical protein
MAFGLWFKKMKIIEKNSNLVPLEKVCIKNSVPQVKKNNICSHEVRTTDIHHIDLDGNVVDVSKDVTNNGTSSYRVFVRARRSRWWALRASPTTAPFMCLSTRPNRSKKNSTYCSAVTSLRETAPALCCAASATVLSTVSPSPPCQSAAALLPPSPPGLSPAAAF